MPASKYKSEAEFRLAVDHLLAEMLDYGKAMHESQGVNQLLASTCYQRTSVQFSKCIGANLVYARELRNSLQRKTQEGLKKIG